MFIIRLPHASKWITRIAAIKANHTYIASKVRRKSWIIGKLETMRIFLAFKHTDPQWAIFCARFGVLCWERGIEILWFCQIYVRSISTFWCASREWDFPKINVWLWEMTMWKMKTMGGRTGQIGRASCRERV